jgi:hypothetical protein
MTHDGKLRVGFYDHERGKVQAHTLKKDWGVDDHNVGSFLVLPDNRLMVFYATHGSKGLYCRSTKYPENIKDWEEEVTVVDGSGATYNHPVYLTEEKRSYVFWRGRSWQPTFATSADGDKWSRPKIIIRQKGSVEYGDKRPYIKIVSEGRSSIHLVFTDGHPRKEPHNSVYYLRYENGAFYRADGRRVSSMDTLPIRHGESDVVYDANPTGIRAWVWDIALDNEGRPVIVYTRLPAETNHRYHYARWTGTKWIDRELCAAGRWFPQTPEGKKEPEPHYSGGICLDHSNPSVVYLSRPIAGVFEIEKWSTKDHGRTWESLSITESSTELNVRPVVPRGYAGKEDHVLWMRGQYAHFKKFKTAIKMAVREN